MSTAFADPRAARLAADQARETAHHVRVRLAGIVALSLLVALAAYGASYYLLPLPLRPSPATKVTAFAVFILSSSLTHRRAPGKTLLHRRLLATAK